MDGLIGALAGLCIPSLIVAAWLRRAECEALDAAMLARAECARLRARIAEMKEVEAVERANGREETLSRALRGPSCGPVHRAADLIVRRHGYAPRDVPSAPLEAAEAIRARIARDVAPAALAGVLVSVIRELLADYPRGLALDAALVRAAAREGVALLKESTNYGGDGNA